MAKSKKTTLPEEIQKLVDEIQAHDDDDLKEIVQEVKQERKGIWDVKKEDKITFFDKRLSYEITGYRPITETEGLDFRPEWFTTSRDNYLRTGHYTNYRRNTKAYADFFDEEYRRCQNGYTVNGYTVTGPMYYYLNYYQLPNIEVEKAGSGRSAIFPKFLVFQYEFFHYFEICRILKKDVCLMKSRGIGFSEINAAICVSIYNCFRESRCMITAQAKNYLEKSLDKTWGALDFANQHTDGGFAKLRQGKDTQLLKRASVISRDQNGIEAESGWLSEIEGVVADTDAKIRGDRVDLLVYEEAGSNPVLRKSYVKGKALIYIGGSKFGIRLCGGTGGDRGVALEALRDMYYDPKSFDVLPFYHNYTPNGDWVYTGYFIPSYIGAVTDYGEDATGERRQLIDERGYCLWQNYKEQLDIDRQQITNPKALVDHCAEYCYTAEEAFALEGENKFNKVNIAEQLTRIRALKQCPPIDVGTIKFTFNGNNHDVARSNVSSVVWNKIQSGHIKILEHPLWTLEQKGQDGELPKQIPMTNNLYVAGIDGIDIGASETSELTKDPSDFCMVIKKRIYGLQDPAYVAIYKDRPDDVREAYKVAIGLAMYYNCMINIEATRRGMVTWARDKHFMNYFMKRPSSTYNDISKRKTTEIGTPATSGVIDHQTDLIKYFVEDYSHTIWFEEMLDELSRYSDEHKRKFDIVAAMAMAELADEELHEIIPKAIKQADEEYQDIGYYYDEKGYKRFGAIPKKTQQFTTNFNPYSNPRYEEYRLVKTSNPRHYF